MAMFDDDADMDDLFAADPAPPPTTEKIKRETEDDDDDDDEQEEEEQKANDEAVIVSTVAEEQRPLKYSVMACAMCVGEIVHPTTLHCGHTFCFECLSETFRADSKENACPICKWSVESYYRKLRPNTMMEACVTLLRKHMQTASPDAMMTDILASLGSMETSEAAKQLAEAINDHAITDVHITRLAKRIAKLQRMHAKAVADCDLFADECRDTRLLATSVVAAHDRGLMINNALMRQAEAYFRMGQPTGLKKEAYNLILVRTTPDMFSDSAKFEKLLRMPVGGIAARTAVVIVECTCSTLGKVINELFAQWDVNEGAMVAQWVEDPKPCFYKRTEVATTHFFMGGSVGPVCVMRSQNISGQVYYTRCPTLAKDYPTDLYDAFHMLFSLYKNKCVINMTGKQFGWEFIVPDEFKKDIAEYDSRVIPEKKVRKRK